MRTFLKLSFVFTLLLALASCKGPDKGDAAKVKDAEKVAAPTVTAKNYIVSAGKVSWIGSKKVSGSSHEGTFDIKGGTLSAEGTAIKSGDFIIDMNSLANTDLEDGSEMQGKLIGHLKSGDFFDVAKFPTASFAVTGAKEVKSDEYNYEVSGNLTMKGATKNVTFPANVIAKEDGSILAVSEKFEIDRMDWGIEYGSGLKGAVGDNVISDKVGMKVELTATPVMQ